MNRKAFLLMLVFVLVSTLALRAESETRILTRSQTEEEKIAEYILADLSYPWDCDPDLYGFTDPPSNSIRFPSEYESTTGIQIGWPSYGCSFSELTELIRIGLDQGIEVVVLAANPTSVKNCLRNRDIPDEQIERIQFETMPIDTIWGRDYLAEVMISSETPNMDSRYGIDMSYYPQPWPDCQPPRLARPNDDAAPTRLVGRAIYNNVYRPQYRHEGGNIQTDGNGTCFMSTRGLNYNRWAQWRYEREDLENLHRQYFGCKRIVILERLLGELTQHIDMWMTVISQDTILANQYGEDDPHPEIERNVTLLESLGYRVVRIPAPKKYCIRRSAFGSCTGRPDWIRVCTGDTRQERRVWATYANSIRIGNAMAVPVYKSVPEELQADIEAQEAEALATFAKELPDVEIIPVVADYIIPCEGAIHCVNITYK